MTVEPVKLIRRTSGWVTSSSAIMPASPGAWVITLIAPGGRPASANTSAHSVPPVIGDSSLGLSTTVLPSARGPTMARPPSVRAAFHGAIAATTPTGRRTANAREPGRSVGRICPVGACASPAAWRSRATLKSNCRPPK